MHACYTLPITKLLYASGKTLVNRYLPSLKESQFTEHLVLQKLLTKNVSRLPFLCIFFRNIFTPEKAISTKPILHENIKSNAFEYILVCIFMYSVAFFTCHSPLFNKKFKMKTNSIPCIVACYFELEARHDLHKSK